ncbi:DUF4286 family protein [Longitalea luteola]|uniref:DUF4286 family protein n=1 Tax=Longitalea luteola TaxID=2812563 RepID=UPI001A95E597|nr:DUF4286 family protein [Longitalea luteola]
MIVYNITYKVDPAIEEVWIKWQQQQHIPEIMACGQFTTYKMFRLLEQDDSEGMTFVIQYFAPSLENYYQFIQEFAPAFSKKAFDKWGNRFIAFRTVMEVVN